LTTVPRAACALTGRHAGRTPPVSGLRADPLHLVRLADAIARFTISTCDRAAAGQQLAVSVWAGTAGSTLVPLPGGASLKCDPGRTEPARRAHSTTFTPPPRTPAPVPNAALTPIATSEALPIWETPPRVRGCVPMLASDGS